MSEQRAEIFPLWLFWVLRSKLDNNRNQTEIEKLFTATDITCNNKKSTIDEIVQGIT